MVNAQNKKANIVVLTGAGMSAESGIPTFRDANGLWENHSIEEVASPEGWQRNPSLVLEFYNARRRKLQEVEPNAAHYFLKELEEDFNLSIVTQNVDDLHERAGSTNVLHLHGELLKVRSEKDESLVYTWKDDLNIGDLAEDNAQLRPHIVWFGEAVPALYEAAQMVTNADILIIIGTSMQVYPAASLYQYSEEETPIIVVNPVKNEMYDSSREFHYIEKTAVEAVSQLRDWLKKYPYT